MSNFLDLSSVISHIEVLRIQPIHQVNSTAKVFPICRTLKTLAVLIDPSSDVQLFRLRFLLKACPSLHKFVLEFNYTGCEMEITEKTKNVEVCPDNQLKVLEIVDFADWEVDMAFARYLIESAVSLEKMIIEPSDWENEGRTRAIKQAELPQSNLKPGVVFQIRE